MNYYNDSYRYSPALYETQVNRMNNLQNNQFYNNNQPFQSQQSQLPAQTPAQQSGVIPVAGIEEAKAYAVDWSGNATYFIDNANNRIYTKQLGLNGVPVLKQYDLVQGCEENEKEYATKEEVDNLKKIIENLLKQLGGGENE